jgi:hypothetical protein
MSNPEWEQEFIGMSDTLVKINNDNAYITNIAVSNAALERTMNDIAEQDDDATNALNLLIRKIEYASQDVNTIHKVEYYIKLVYWLVFLTWCACILYERRFTMKTGGLFVLFTLFILLQNRIMNLVGFMIPADVNVKW